MAPGKAVSFLILVLPSVFYKKPRKSCPCSEQKKHVGNAIQSTTMAKASDHRPDCLLCSVCNTQRTTYSLYCFEGGFLWRLHSGPSNLKFGSVMKSVKDIAKGHFTEMPRRAQQSMHRLALSQLPQFQ